MALSFLMPLEKRDTIRVKYTLRNIGNVPATNIRIQDKISSSLSEAMSRDIPNATALTEAMFGDGARPIGITLFPNDEFVIVQTPGITADEIKYAIPPDSRFFPSIVGCVGYLSINVKEPHETEFWGQLDLLGDLSPGFPRTLADGGEIEQSRMNLHKTIFGASAR